MTKPTLLMIAPAPVELLSGDRLRLDAKFVEGMRLHVAQWDGPLRVILWRGGAIPFGLELARADLGFDLTVLAPDQPLTPAHLARAGVVCASADLHQTFDLPGMMAGAKLVYVVEYTLATRLRILWLDRGLSPLRKLRSALWHLAQERRRRRAFRAADGVQANGWPAHLAYAGLAPDTLLYLDGRMRAGMMATPAEMAARATPGPLRIAHSGRLEPLKGAQDLIPVAQALVARGVEFTLDIWGAGSLVPEIRAGIAAGLQDRVRLHDPLPFEEGLVPALRQGADLFLSCHRQADPSCSYLEAMGCGLPVAGYDNAMWRRLAEASQGGQVVPMGDVAALADRIATWAADRSALAAAADRALAFARAHDFEGEFARRMDHLARIAQG